ncbi:MAG: metal-dependent hydrolase [Thermoplasmata archaeon]
MFLLGHLGLTLALVVGARRRFVDLRVDYRVLLAAALLPDLIDKPLSLAFGIGGRSYGHTLLFAVTLTGLFLLARSWPVIRRPGTIGAAALLPLAIGTWTHLLLDRMWALPEILFWPFLGFAFPVDPFDLSKLLLAYQDPYVLVGDVLGAVALGFLVWRHRVYRRANLLRVLRRGRLERGTKRLPPSAGRG